MEIDNGFAGTGSGVVPPLPHLRRQAMEPEEEAIFGQNDMFFMGITIEGTQLSKISGI